MCNHLRLNAQHKSVVLQLPPPEEQGVNKLKAVHNILDLHCMSKIRVKHSSGMYNVVLDWALHHKRVKHCVFHQGALQQVQMQVARVQFISILHAAIQTFQFEFLSLCVKKKKNISKTKNGFWGL